MTPVTFATSFGWYHDAGGTCGIVICAAQGHEDLCTHKSLRLMADAFAAQGYPSLRFDYAGTGDSLGGDRDPERLETWITSIEDAVQWLRTTARVEKIVLVGLRFGSALAALAADRLGTISGLVLLAPVVTGRAYMRELSTLSNLIRKPEGADKASLAADLEIAGFLFTPETVKDIGAIDLTGFRKAPAPEVLIVAIETQAAAERLAKSWSGLGSHVENQVFSHYAEFMMDPAFSRYPAEALQRTLAWLAAHFDPGRREASSQSLRYRPQEEDHFSEHPVFFGGDKNLFGMICVPRDLDTERPAIVYLNAGANHHIGWGRSTVEVCRKLAGLGLVSLRIDIGAIGDSPDPASDVEQILYRDESTQDVSAAIDWLEAQGFRDVTVIGLCAGAHLSFHTAVADPRVSRIVMVNLQKFIWHKGDSLIVAFRETYRSTGFYLRQIFVPDTWRRLLRGEVKARGIFTMLVTRLRKKAKALASSAADRFGTKTNGEIARVKGWMKELDRRKVRQCYVLSVGDAGLDELSLYRRIRGTRVKGAPYVSVAFIENADHNLSQHAARDVFLGILQDILCAEKDKTPDNAARPASRSFALPQLL
ncbi:serine aminopeptidase domain-containing protein [Methyloferula stellata]|uniref:serine aminopeptidase domain-containing protein n=1 Tax=Methyloferula stellata TaxID=876270 RepID=UPI00036DEF1F|nr:alpha/beta hydrolase [Methyloferula stellata]